MANIEEGGKSSLTWNGEA